MPEERGGRGSVGERLARGKQHFPRKLGVKNLFCESKHVSASQKSGERRGEKAGEGEGHFQRTPGPILFIEYTGVVISGGIGMNWHGRPLLAFKMY